MTDASAESPPRPMVSVCLVTYNQEQYIAQAIESVLMQKTAFDCVAVVGEDCSTDGTRAMVLDYARRHPGRVWAQPRERNLGMIENGVRTLRACHGKYVAFLDGDDYWTDSGKLQMQVDFLEQHPDFAGIFHPAEIVDGGGRPTGRWQRPPIAREFYTVDDFLRHCAFTPCSARVCRRDCIDPAKPAHWLVDLSSSMGGKIAFVDRVMSAYRQHDGGVYSKLSHAGAAEEVVRQYSSLTPVFRGSSHMPALREGRAKARHKLALAYLRDGRRWKATGTALRALAEGPATLREARSYAGMLLRLHFGRIHSILTGDRNGRATENQTQ